MTGCPTLQEARRGAQEPISLERKRIVFIEARSMTVLRVRSALPKGGSSTRPDHAVGERKVRAAAAAHEAPRAAIGARLVPVPFAPQKEDYLPTPAARERQTPGYPYLGNAHVTIPS